MFLCSLGLISPEIGKREILSVQSKPVLWNSNHSF